MPRRRLPPPSALRAIVLRTANAISSRPNASPILPDLFPIVPGKLILLGTENFRGTRKNSARSNGEGHGLKSQRILRAELAAGPKDANSQDRVVLGNQLFKLVSRRRASRNERNKLNVATPPWGRRRTRRPDPPASIPDIRPSYRAPRAGNPRRFPMSNLG